MAIEIIPVPAFTDNYIWLMLHPGDNRALCVDPGDAKPVRKYCDDHGISLSAILLTHHHFDHMGGAQTLQAHFNCPVYGPKSDGMGFIDNILADERKVTIAGYDFEVMTTPGHTLDHIVFRHEDILFCGDTLFAGGCGRLFEGSPDQMYRSLQRLTQLPGHTRVFCAHEYTQDNLRFAAEVEPENEDIRARLEEVKTLKVTLPSTIAQELATNPFLRCQHASVQAAATQHIGREVTDPIDTFAIIRDWKNSFS